MNQELYNYLKNNGWPAYCKKAIKELEKRGRFEISAYESLLNDTRAINKLGYKTTCAFRIVPSEDKFSKKTFITVYAKSAE